MNSKLKLIAFYLPQFHSIPENDEWWGKGFTEWVNVKNAQPLYENHDQPKVPLDNNYYNLLDDNTKIWQAKIAKENGVDAFCYYHYWFNGKKLLYEPMEQMLRNPDINIEFCISWANEAWTKAWINESKVLIEQKYGDKTNWLNHYQYLSRFFKDDRYIKVNEKPLFIIYRPNNIPCLKSMLLYWEELAKQDGFPGLYVISQRYDGEYSHSNNNLINGNIIFQPTTAIRDYNRYKENIVIVKTKSYLNQLSNSIERKYGFSVLKKIKHHVKYKIQIYDYKQIWQIILNYKYKSTDIPGAFPSWDNTPRHKKNGSVVQGTPEEFCYYLTKLIKLALERNDNFIFINAWNEWAEGAILEPTVRDGYKYLEAVKDARENNNI